MISVGAKMSPWPDTFSGALLVLSLGFCVVESTLYRDEIVEDAASLEPPCVLVLEKFARPQGKNCQMEEVRGFD